jgi:hypothetical protein
LSSGREVYKYQDRKTAARRAFNYHPKKKNQYLQKFLKITREKMGIE